MQGTNKIYILWISTGLGCEGCTIAVTQPTDPSLEDILLGKVEGLPEVILIHPLLSYETGESLLEYYRKAESGEINPFILVLEGAVPNEDLAKEGWWASFGSEGGRIITTNEWLKKLAPKAEAVIAIGSCAVDGGIPASKGNVTGAMGLSSFLGKDFKSKAGLPIINIPGCPPSGQYFIKTLISLIQYLTGKGPMPEILKPGVSIFRGGKSA